MPTLKQKKCTGNECFLLSLNLFCESTHTEKIALYLNHSVEEDHNE